MKRILLLLLVACLLVGCGKQGAEQGPAPASAPPSSKPSAVLERPQSEPESAVAEHGASSQSASAPLQESPSAAPAEPPEESASNDSPPASQDPIEFPAVAEVTGGLRYTFAAPPQTAQQLEGILDPSDPRHTAALFMAALVRYVDAPEDGVAMIDALRGPQPMSDGDKNFLKERLSDKAYLPRAYFEGATPQNSYTPHEPLALIVYDDPVQAEEGYRYVLVSTTGADSKRRIVLREKDGSFYIWEYPGILSGIRLPADEDPWA